MCIAILNTSGTIDKETFLTCWENNPHGGGIAWAENGQVNTSKEMKSPEHLYKMYTKIRQDNLTANILIHFRIATHGRINETNCHPFLVNKNLAFIHNGMISGEGLTTSNDFSDTYLFNQLFLQQLPKNFTRNEAIINLIASYIGYSKLIFLDSSDQWTIVNEHLGNWDGENWYSNDSYISAKKEKSRYNYSTYSYFQDNFCDCCQSSGKTKYVPDYQAYLCQSCVKEFA